MMADRDEKSINLKALWASYRENADMSARDQLAEHYLPLVSIIAGRVAIGLPAHVDKDDLISSGFFGLLDALSRYDFHRKNKFETYAGVRIRGAMLDYLRSKDWIPVSMRQKIRRYEKAVARLEGELGRSATDAEIASDLHLSIPELEKLIKQLNVATIVPLEDYIKTEQPRAVGLNPQEKAENDEVKDILAAAIDKLPARERTVVSLYYYEELTLKEISLVLHLSEARISQINTKAVFRLRGYLARVKSDLL
jgi:RNA polymerase sigma factor for flagellar operon FliA